MWKGNYRIHLIWIVPKEIKVEIEEVTVKNLLKNFIGKIRMKRREIFIMSLTNYVCKENVHGLYLGKKKEKSLCYSYLYFIKK